MLFIRPLPFLNHHPSHIPCSSPINQPMLFIRPLPILNHHSITHHTCWLLLTRQSTRALHTTPSFPYPSVISPACILFTYYSPPQTTFHSFVLPLPYLSCLPSPPSPSHILSSLPCSISTLFPFPTPTKTCGNLCESSREPRLNNCFNQVQRFIQGVRSLVPTVAQRVGRSVGKAPCFFIRRPLTSLNERPVLELEENHEAQA